MISWIQRNFQQHFKWLFLAVLIVVIVSFVGVTNASRGLSRGDERHIPPKPFFGLDLSKADDQRRLGSDAQLSIYLRFKPQREVPESQASQYALSRHAALHLADQIGLPEPGEKELIAHIQTLAAFAGPDGKFDPKRYTEFSDSLKTNPRLNEADASRVIAEDARIAAYEKLLGGPGYVLPSDVSEILAKRDTTWTLAVASIDASAFAPAIETSDATLQTWFDSNVRRYEIPARVSVASLGLPSSKFAGTIALTEAEIRAAYDANPSRYPTPPAAKDAKPDPITGKDTNADAAFLAARPLVEAELRKQRADQAALAAASDLAVQLLEQNVKPADLSAFVAQHPELTLTEVGPVGTGSIPPALGGNSASAKIAPEVQRLAADRPYSNPVPTPAGAAILVWRENIAARTPTLAEVHDTVLADYKAAEKHRLFNEAGRKLQTDVAAAVAAGKPFADAVTAAATAAGLKATVKTPAPFTLSGQFPQDMDYSALQALQTLAKGKVSNFLPSGDTAGTLVYAIDQKVPPVDTTAPAYVEMRTRLASNLAQSNAQSIIAAAVEAELAKSAPSSD